jgi:broad specificity phosphatase PhoE
MRHQGCELILVRHGQTACTSSGRFCGSHDPKLSPVGERMAEYMSQHPSFENVDLMLSSPSNRTRATAQTIAAAAGVPFAVDERLREMSFGRWENLLPSEIEDQLALEQWRQDPAFWNPPGGESGLEVMARTMNAVRDAVRSSGRVVLITHKAPIRLIVAFFLGLSPSVYREVASVAVGSITHLCLGAQRPRLRSLGDLSHLPRSWRDDPDTINDISGLPISMDD